MSHDLKWMSDISIPHAHSLPLFELWHSNPWYSFRHHPLVPHCWSFGMFSTPLILFCLGFSMQETEGWILSLLTSEQQFYIQISFFSLGTRAWNLMHCKSNPLFPFPHPSPAPLFCILFCDTFLQYLSIFKEILCIFHLQKCYQIYAATLMSYTHTHTNVKIPTVHWGSGCLKWSPSHFLH